MSVLVYAENAGGLFKKATFEAITYAFDIAGGAPVTAVAIGPVSNEELQALGQFGATRVLHVADASFQNFDARVYARIISDAAAQVNATKVVLSNTYSGKALAPRVAVRMKAGLVPAAVELPSANGIKRTVYSNKGFADTVAKTSSQVISLTPNAYKVEGGKSNASVESFAASVSASDYKVRTIEVKKVTGKIPLTEAEVVVSGGRGLKGPENWHLIENLAETLGAATACSKPVSDMHWRSHDEHVGQTGITIKPNLYIAVGISGAIQHLAGVSGSKVIVAINTDKEAPFFKIADYGIVGDAFEVLPQLNNAIKALKAAN